MPARTNRPEPDQAAAPKRGPKQSELFAKFSHLDRHRAAVGLATRVLRILAPADPETAEIAIEIASTATRMQAGPNGIPGVPPPASPEASLPGAPRL